MSSPSKIQRSSFVPSSLLKAVKSSQEKKSLEMAASAFFVEVIERRPKRGKRKEWTHRDGEKK